jgi:hypothetical protein
MEVNMSYRRRGSSLIDELMAFEEWMERKEELKKRKDTDKRKTRDTQRGLTFAEGVIVAIVMQPLFGALTKYVEHIILQSTH